MIREARGVQKWFFRGKGDSNRFFAVQETDLYLRPGKVTVLTGRSGSGKTTLLSMAGGLLKPDGGSIRADGTDLYAMDDEALSRFRNQHFGMIPQVSGALKSLNVMENILLAGGIYPASGEEDNTIRRAERAKSLMQRMNIGDLGGVYPEELSGGELRRVSVARALAGTPDVIFADEPTSDLDDENMDIVLKILRESADEGAAVLIVTHDREALAFADTALKMDGGRICEE